MSLDTRADDRGVVSTKRAQVFKATLGMQIRLLLSASTPERRVLCLRHLEEHLSHWAPEVRSHKELHDDIRREWKTVFGLNKEVAAVLLHLILRLPITDDCETQSADWMETIWDALPPQSPTDIPHIISCVVDLLKRSCSWADRIVDGTVSRCRRWLGTDYEDTTIPHECGCRLLLALREHVPWLLGTTPELRQPSIADLAHPTRSESPMIRQLGADCIVALVELGALDVSPLSVAPLMAILEGEEEDEVKLHGALLAIAGLIRATLTTSATVWAEVGLLKVIFEGNFPETALIRSAVVGVITALPLIDAALLPRCWERMIDILSGSDENDRAAQLSSFTGCNEILKSVSAAESLPQNLLLEVAERLIVFIGKHADEDLPAECQELLNRLPDLIEDELLIQALRPNVVVDQKLIFQGGLNRANALLLQTLTELDSSVLEEIHDEILEIVRAVTTAEDVTPAQMIPAIEYLRGISDPGNLDLHTFVNDCVIPLLSHSDPEVRKVAVTTSIHFASGEASAPNGVRRFVTGIVDRMLQLLVADPCEDVRLTVIKSLNTSLDSYLCMPDGVDGLERASHDPCDEVYVEALRRLCQLAARNQASVNPKIMKAQQIAVKDITQGLSIRSRHRGTAALSTMLDLGCLQLPPLETEKQLLGAMQTVESLQVQASIMVLISQIISVSASHQKHVDEQQLISLCESGMHDQTYLPKQMAALKLLRALLRRVSSLHDTFLRNSSLLSSLRELSVSPDRTQELLRRSALHTLGMIGAIDPGQLRRTRGSGQSSSNAPNAAQDCLRQFRPPYRVHPKVSNEFPSIALHTMLRHVLFQHGSATEQLMALRCAQDILQETPNESRPQLAEKLIPLLLLWLKDPDRSHLQGAILHILHEVCPLMKSSTSLAKFGAEVLMILSELRSTLPHSSAALNYSFVVLLQQLAVALPELIKQHTWTVSYLVERLSQDRLSPMFLRATLSALNPLLQSLTLDRDFLGVIPLVLDCMSSEEGWETREINTLCISFFTDLISHSAMQDQCASIIHYMTHLIETTTDESLGQGILSFLCGLLIITGSSTGRYFIDSLETLVKRKKIVHDSFQQLLTTYKAFGHFPEPGFKIPVVKAASNPPLRSNTVFRIASTLTTMTRFRLSGVIAEQLKIPRSDIHVTGPPPEVVAPNCVLLDVSFSRDDNFEYNMLSFFRRAHDDSAFANTLGLQSITVIDPTPEVSVKKLSAAFALPTRHREMDWVKWLNNLELQLVAGSSHSVLRALARLHDATAERSILPFAVHSFLTGADDNMRASIMDRLSSAVKETTSHDVRTTLFTLAEFMESERAEEAAEVTETKQLVDVTVVRRTLNDKFGINYERGDRGVIVKKITPGLPGDIAKVPLGAVLLRIDGVPTHTTEDVKELITNKVKVVLSLEKIVQEAPVSKKRPFFDISILAKSAKESFLHEKAIHYTELLFEDIIASDAITKEPELVLQVTNALIDVCHIMDQTREAKGVLKFVDEKLRRDATAPEKLGYDHIQTLEKLNWWSRAKELYEQRLASTPPEEQSELDILGLMRCHKAMGDHPAIVDFIRTSWELTRPSHRTNLVPHCAEAAFALGEWDLLAELIPTAGSNVLHTNPIPVIASHIRSEHHQEAYALLKQLRQQTEKLLIASSTDSVVGAHDLLIQLQHVTHLEEVLAFLSENEDQQQVTHAAWKRRFLQMAPQPHHLLTTASINRLVLSPVEDLDCQLRLASVCRKHGWIPLGQYIMSQLLDTTAGGRLLPETPPKLASEHCKQMWHVGARTEAFVKLRDFLNERPSSSTSDVEAVGKCYMMLAEWDTQLNGLSDEAQGAMRRATELIPQNAEAWHAFGMMQYLAGYGSREPKRKLKYFVSAIQSLFRAVQLSDEVLGTQDTLRIVQMWFTFGNSPQVHNVIQAGIKQTSLSVWLRVIPQLVARLGMQDEIVRDQLENLLSSLGRQFPHLLVGPLIVVDQDDSERYAAAQRVLRAVREADERLVEQYSIIRRELIRMAIIWSERWAEAMVTASKSKSNAKAMLKTLGPLFDELNNPQTPNEKSFASLYGVYLKRCRNSLNNDELSQAWSALNHVYGQIDRTNRSTRSLKIADVAPDLLEIKNCCVPVPGKDSVLIGSFRPDIAIISSKQKPRRFGMNGADGQIYRFLLKGREDLRQDERAMQLFSLINTVLTGDPIGSAEGLCIETYNVTPLSSNVGIVGWIESAETIFKMIEARRHLHGISIYKECEMIVKKGGLRDIDSYHQLPLETRKRLLQYVSDNSSPNELRTIFWDNNETCKSYLEYRRQYTHSMATMSMVGYILGLGDRHLNNLMIVNTGAVAHIDFGDCFEVARKRSYYPEAVPFRLTRLLVAAMGVTGVAGAFRSIAEHVMGLLRKYKESLLSVLETFVYDPLIVWRFAATTEAAKSDKAGEAAEKEKPGLQAPAQNARDQAAAGLSFSLGVKSYRDNGDNEPFGEWRKLADFLSHDVGKIPTEKEMHFPDKVTPAAAIENIRKLVLQGDLPRAVAWWRHARQLFPETVMFGMSLTAGSFHDGERQSLQSFCLQQSLTTQQNDVAKQALSRVQSKLLGTDFTSQSPMTNPAASELTLGSARPVDANQQVIFFGTTPMQRPDGGSSFEPAVAPEPTTELDVEPQVSRLIEEARSMENLAMAYVTGWAPFW